MKLLVLGASGGCGRWVCKLAAERGHSVRAVVRPQTPFDAPTGVDVIRGSVLDQGVIGAALADCDAVASALGIKRRSALNPWSPISSPADLTTQVAEVLVKSLPSDWPGRIVTISAAGVGDSLVSVHPAVRWMIDNSSMAASYADLAGMERVLGNSNLDWMAVRPTTLATGGPTEAVRVVRRYGLLAHIRRSDVADWMLRALEQSSQVEDRTPMIAG